jgi:hypothetical protein
MPKSEDSGSIRILGAVLILAALLLNPHLIEQFLFSGRQLPSIYRVYILAWEGVLGLFGMYFALNRRHRLLPKITIFIASVLVMLLVAECGVRNFWYKNATCGWKARNVHRSEVNQCGYRGQAIQYADDEFVILLAGDSQAEALACAYAWMPERRLEHHLRARGRKVRVFTVGSGGYGSDQELLAVRDYLKSFRADLVLVWLTPKNDIWNNMFPTHWARNGAPKPTYWMEDGALRGPVPGAYIGKVPCAGSRIADVIRRSYVRGGRDPDGYWAKTFLPPPYRPLREYQGPVLKDWQERWDANISNCRGDNLGNEKAHWAISLAPRSSRMQYGIDLTHALLNEISSAAALKGAKFGIFIPVYVDPPPVAGEVAHSLNGKFYMTSSDQFDANIRDVTRGFETRQIPVQLKEHEVGPEDDHLNEHAVDQVMEGLADALASGIPLPANPAAK